MEEELWVGPTEAPLAENSGVIFIGVRVVVDAEGDGAAVCGHEYDVRGVHEGERHAEKLVLVTAFLSCTSHSALHAR
jgi:hypothetical protein